MSVLVIATIVNSLLLLALALALGFSVSTPAPPVSRLPGETRRLVHVYEKASFVLAALVLVTVILYFAGVPWVRLGGAHGQPLSMYLLTLMFACRLMAERPRRQVRPA